MNPYTYNDQTIGALIHGEDDQPIIITCPEHGDYRLTVGQHMEGECCPLCHSENGYPPIETHKWAYTEQRVVTHLPYEAVRIHTVRVYTGYVAEQFICVPSLWDFIPRPLQRLGEHRMEVMVTADTEEVAKAMVAKKIAYYVLKQFGPAALRATCLETQTCKTFDE